MSYLHGVEIKQKDTLKIFRNSETSLVALVGVAAEGDNELTLVTNLEQAEAKYGLDLPGTTILNALKSLYKDGNAPVIVLNVADATDQSDMLDGTAVGVESNKYYTEINEESLGALGNSLSGLEAKLIAGIELLKTAEAKFGMKPNFIIAPGYSQVLSIGAKMRSVAATLKAKALIDIYAASVVDAIISRNTNYSYSDKRVILCFPNMLVLNEDFGVDVQAPLSQLLAAEFIATHEDVGFWQSPSNRELTNVKGSAVAIIGSLTDSGADNQLLNAKGIVTIFKTQGNGTRLWGNWTAAFPTDASLKGMIAASIVEDVIEETIQRESLSFMDKNIGYAALDFIVASVQNYFNTMKAQGAILDANIWYEKAKNPIANVQAGQFVFSYDFCAHPSLDRLTYESYLNVQYLEQLFQ
ncbi:MAG: phage tail sheath subtilisin-like domain-containing protein [Chitinophagales bacterium]|nr:phage tail sheath subtilisin-like domain-containing protein [Chitinophagales bacterium]